MHANDESAASGKPIPIGKRGQRDRLRQRDWLRQRDGLRCELVPVPSSEYVGSFRSKLKPTAPPLVLDVGTNGAIQVIDANTNALIASDWLAQVTATPAMYRYAGGETDQGYMQPLLIVDIPGLKPLRIGASPMGRGYRGIPVFRYAWRGSVQHAKKPAYVVTEAEWLTLVQKFGLGSRVVDEHASGEIQRRDRRAKVRYYAGWAFCLILVVAVIIYHFVR